MLDSLKESLNLIWKNNVWFLFLFILQIVFIATLSIVSYNYQLRIVEHSNAISEYISNLNLDEAAVADNFLQQKSILGDDPLMINREFNEILKNIRLMLVSLFLVMVFFMSLGWTLANKAMHKIGFRQLLGLYSRILVILSLCLGLIFTFFYFLLNLSLSQKSLEPAMLLPKYLLFFIFSLVLLHFMETALSLAHKTGFGSMIQDAFFAGIRKFHYALGVYSINFLFLLASALVFINFYENSIIALFASTMLFVFGIVFGRFFMIKTFEKID